MNVLKTKHGPHTGFFSNCSVRLHQIVRYFNKHKRLPDRVCSQGHFHLYRDDQESDVTKILFLEDTETQIPYRHRIDFLHSKQFSNYKLLLFSDILPLVEKYFTVSPLVAERELALARAYALDFDNLIGVRFRGNDKVTEVAVPPYEALLEKAGRLLEEHPGMRFLVQTDELEFLAAFRARFPQTIHFESLPPMAKDATTSIIPPENQRFAFGLEFLAAIRCFSRCRYLVMSSGNAELWAVLFRGHAEGVYQHLEGRFVDRVNVPWGRRLVKWKRYFGKIGWVYRWIGRRYFGFKPV